MAIAYLTAIIICQFPGEQPRPYKYRSIHNTSGQLKKFYKLAQEKPGFHHINFYNPQTKKFFKQVTAADLQAAQVYVL